MDVSSPSSRSFRPQRARPVKGPYLTTHSKLSLGLDRLLPAIAAVEASTADLMGGGSATAAATGFSENEQYEVQSKSRRKKKGGPGKARFRQGEPLWVDAPPEMRGPARMPVGVVAGAAAAVDAAASSGDVEDEKVANDSSGRLLRDFRTLAAASRRANNAEAEANAYYCLAVLHDNAGALVKAMTCYTKFARISEAIGHVEAQAIACNALGVNCTLQGRHAEAVEFHTEHLAAVRDHTGRFLANTNLGLLASAQGDLGGAKGHHSDALRAAVQTGSLQAESVATANLGRLSMQMGDWSASKAQLERYLQLSLTLKDTKGKSEAYMFLGELCSATGDLAAASDYYAKALKESTGTKQEQVANSAKCSFGVVSGTMSLHKRMQELRTELS